MSLDNVNRVSGHCVGSGLWGVLQLVLTALDNVYRVSEHYVGSRLWRRLQLVLMSLDKVKIEQLDILLAIDCGGAVACSDGTR